MRHHSWAFRQRDFSAVKSAQVHCYECYCQVKCQGSTESKKLTDKDLQTLKRTMRNNCQSSLSIIAEMFRRSSGTEVSNRTILVPINH